MSMSFIDGTHAGELKLGMGPGLFLTGTAPMRPPLLPQPFLRAMMAARC